MSAIKVKGMSCNHCVMRVTKALQAIEGIKNVKVDLQSGEATYDEDKPIDRKVIAEQIRKAGYEAE
jgi:copper chaperone